VLEEGGVQLGRKKSDLGKRAKQKAIVGGIYYQENKLPITDIIESW